MQIFRDRRDAGARLARKLEGYAERPDVIVLALPRGGVPVGYEIAKHLQVPLDVLVVRKLGTPGHSELAMGAIASGGVQVLDRDIIGTMNVSAEAIATVIESEREELERREHAYRGDRPALDVAGKTVIAVDDGLATGSTMLAAIEALKRRRAAGVVVAVPVAPPETCASMRPRVDEIICLLRPDRFRAVGQWYRDFTQTSDEEVRRLLADNLRKLHDRDREVEVAANTITAP